MPFRAETPDQKSQMKYIIYDLENSDFKPMAFLETLFSCLFGYTASVYDLLLAIYTFVVKLKEKKAVRKIVFSPPDSYVIEILARIVLGCVLLLWVFLYK